MSMFGDEKLAELFGFVEQKDRERWNAANKAADERRNAPSPLGEKAAGGASRLAQNRMQASMYGRENRGPQTRVTETRTVEHIRTEEDLGR